MTNQDFASYPPPPPPPPASKRSIQGKYVVLAGIVFAFLPLLITLVASIFIHDAFNEGTSSIGALPWLTILTMPIGFAVVVVGLVIGAKNVATRK